MMTPDKDFGQLVDEHTFIYKPPRGGGNAEIMGVKEVCKRWEIERVDQVIDILGLMGDTVIIFRVFRVLEKRQPLNLLKNLAPLKIC